MYINQKLKTVENESSFSFLNYGNDSESSLCTYIVVVVRYHAVFCTISDSQITNIVSTIKKHE